MKDWNSFLEEVANLGYVLEEETEDFISFRNTKNFELINLNTSLTQKQILKILKKEL